MKIIATIMLCCLCSVAIGDKMSVDHSVAMEISDPQLVSRYNPDTQSLAINLFLDKDSELTFQLFDRDATIVKIWEPKSAKSGKLQTILPLSDIAEGTYMLNVEIGQQAYQQVVWIY